MKKITNYDELYKILKLEDEIICYISSTLCSDCLVTSYSLEQILKDNTIQVYEIDYATFELFCNEYEFKYLPTLVKMRGFQLVKKIGNGNIITRQEILNFINN